MLVKPIDISVVVPVYNEYESLPELEQWIDRVMTANKFSYQLILIDDGSSDESWEVIEQLIEKNDSVLGLRFRRNYGKSAALYCGFDEAQGEVVITMDADLQDSPDEIPALYKMIVEEGYDLVSGWKKERHDPIGKRWPSKFFNATARVVSGIKLHDFNCGLKAYRRKVIKSIEVYGEMHRYIPILAKQAGFKRIGEKVVCHRARKYGVSKFGWERMIKGYLDLLSVMFMSKFGRSPMYFFGSLGTLMFLFGGGAAIWIVLQKVIRQANGLVWRSATDQPLFYLSLVAVVLGVLLFLAGFLGELINRNSSDRNRYLIDEIKGANGDLINE
jgi:glycosyltransferase involved in cell wall biosynthesis